MQTGRVFKLLPPELAKNSHYIDCGLFIKIKLFLSST